MFLFSPGGAACQLVPLEHPTTHRPMITRCFSVDNKDFETQDEIEALDSSVHSLLFRSRFQLAGLASCLLAVCVFLVLYWRRKKLQRPSLDASNRDRARPIIHARPPASALVTAASFLTSSLTTSKGVRCNECTCTCFYSPSTYNLCTDDSLSFISRLTDTLYPSLINCP